ncbi:MAG: hypothetical protein LLG05_05415 [Porphyromonadaceae bacterium]|nr:hypothetical protein [Porphyromonadaceae bacterium]
MTTAQKALEDFEKTWLTVNYVGMTSAQKTTHIQTHYDLKIKAVKEIEANKIESEAANTAAQTANLADSKSKLQSLGYLCDNSQADWNKLFNRPEMFGVNWQTMATYQKSISTGVDYFLQQAQSILFMPYEIGKYYKVGDTFQYGGKYYKVIQAHTSQAAWVPSATPSLYTEITGSATIAAFKQPTGSTDAYKKGDKVTYNGSTYESLIDANVWSPDAYPAGWQKL